MEEKDGADERDDEAFLNEGALQGRDRAVDEFGPAAQQPRHVNAYVFLPLPACRISYHFIFSQPEPSQHGKVKGKEEELQK
jgi:hypothetical protein